MKKIVLVLVYVLLSACSTTTSDVHQLMASVDRSAIKGVRLVVEGEKIQLSSQSDTRIHTLHQSKEDVLQLAALVAKRYGFDVLDSVEPVNQTNGSDFLTDRAVFSINIAEAMPDGGACVEGLSYAAQNLSYAGSVLTLGVSPASIEHCIVVRAELFRHHRGEQELVGEYTSNAGRVAVYAGANEVDNYQLTVSRRDEIRGLEVSIGGLLNAMISDFAFEEIF
jgi:hypothetical protein